MTAEVSEDATVERPEYLGEPTTYWAELADREDPLSRRLAAHALGMIGTAGKNESLAPLTRLAHDPESFVRVWAAANLMRVDPGNPEALEGLYASLHDERNFVRSLGAWFLGRLCPRLHDLDKVAERLEPLTEDEDPSVRTEATLALQIVRHKNIRPSAACS